MRRLARLVPCVLLVVEIVLALSILRDIANVTTYRLYLADRTDAAPHSTATEQFLVEDTRVVPQIAARGEEHVAFRWTKPWPATLHVTARASAPSRYEIHWRDGADERVLARSDGDANAAEITAPIPRRGEVEFVSDGSVTWVDPRLVGTLRITGRTLAFAALACWLAVSLRTAARSRTGHAWRAAPLRAAALGTGVVIAMLFLEAGLRALGDRVPPIVLNERRDLGEVRRDPRWEHTNRYGRRLRPNISDVSEWRHGDIVRMGFIPAGVSDGILHRFPFHTDDEGFRNARTRDRIDVAALGDSFTDAMTLDAADAWTTLVERQTGLAVQNYGTAGFGPQQELRVLTDYALRHRPRVVVLAYFAGNDIFDAEAFDEFEQSHGAIHRPDPGWPIRSVFNQADSLYVVSALHAFGRWASSRELAEARTTAPPRDEARTAAPIFDRGMFSLSVNGRALRFALMPPYLNKLMLSQRDLEARHGWQLATRAINDMREASAAAGARFVVMFLPSKSQVYLPLLQEAVPAGELQQAFRFYVPEGPIDVATVARNRLVQNAMLRAFCERSHIPFVDTTAALEAAMRRGGNVYFPDESHLNEAGHAVVAETIQTFLR